MLPKLLIDLRVLEVLQALDSQPVLIVPNDARHDEVEELVGGEDILLYQLVFDDVINSVTCDSPSVVLGELSFEPVFYCGILICVCWHIY